MPRHSYGIHACMTVKGLNYGVCALLAQKLWLRSCVVVKEWQMLLLCVEVSVCVCVRVCACARVCMCVCVCVCLCTCLIWILDCQNLTVCYVL